MSNEFFELPDLPPEVKEAVEKELDRRMMIAESRRHDIQRLFDELSKDQLLTLRQVFSDVSTELSGRYASYLEGCLSAILHYKHNICAGCGENHEEKFVAQAVENEEEHNLELYNLVRIPGETWVACKNCGQAYPSIQDRMLNPPGPEGCEGCIHKAKWG